MHPSTVSKNKGVVVHARTVHSSVVMYKKTHSSAGLCWLTLVHIGSHGPQCNQWRLHLHQLWPFPYFPFKLSNSLMPPAFHRKFSMIRTSKLHICGHCLHCIKDATIDWNHVFFLVISILRCPWTSLSFFCTSKTSPRPLFVFCTTSIRSCTQPHRFLLGQVWEVSIVCHVACSMLCIYLCSL